MPAADSDRGGGPGVRTYSDGSTLPGRPEVPVNKRVIWLGMLVGSTIGGCIPMLWHGSVLSLSAVALSTVGGLVGIWAAYRLAR